MLHFTLLPHVDHDIPVEVVGTDQQANGKVSSRYVRAEMFTLQVCWMGNPYSEAIN